MDNPQKPKKAKQAPRSPETVEDFLALARDGRLPEEAAQANSARPSPIRKAVQTPPPDKKKPKAPERPKITSSFANPIRDLKDLKPRTEPLVKDYGPTGSTTNMVDQRAGIEAVRPSNVAQDLVRGGGEIAKALSVGIRGREAYDAAPAPVQKAVKGVGEFVKGQIQTEGRQLKNFGAAIGPDKGVRGLLGSAIMRYGENIQRPTGMSNEEIEADTRMYGDDRKLGVLEDFTSEIVNPGNYLGVGYLNKMVKAGKMAPAVAGRLSAGLGAVTNPWEESTTAERAVLGVGGAALSQGAGKLARKGAETAPGKALVGVAKKGAKAVADKAGQVADYAGVKGAEVINNALPDPELEALQKALQVAEHKGNRQQIAGIKRQIVKHAMKPDPVTPGDVKTATAAGAGVAGAVEMLSGEEEEGGALLTAAAFFANPEKGMAAARKLAPQKLAALIEETQKLAAKATPDEAPKYESALASLAAVREEFLGQGKVPVTTTEPDLKLGATPEEPAGNLLTGKQKASEYRSVAEQLRTQDPDGSVNSERWQIANALDIVAHDLENGKSAERSLDQIREQALGLYAPDFADKVRRVMAGDPEAVAPLREPNLGAVLSGKDVPSMTVPEPGVLQVADNLQKPARKEANNARHKLHQVVTGRFNPYGETDIADELSGAAQNEGQYGHDWAKLAWEIGQVRDGWKTPEQFLEMYGKDADGLYRPEVQEALSEMMEAEGLLKSAKGETEKLVGKFNERRAQLWEKKNPRQEVEVFGEWPKVDATKLRQMGTAIELSPEEDALLDRVSGRMSESGYSLADYAKKLTKNERQRLKDILARGGLLGAAGAAALSADEDSDVQKAVGFGAVGAVRPWGKYGNFKGRVPTEVVEKFKHLPWKEAYKKIAKQHPEFAKHIEKVNKAYKEIATPVNIRRWKQMYEQGAIGTQWYEASRQAFIDHFPDEVERKSFIDLVAFFSAMQKVGKDLDDALVIKYANELGYDINKFDKKVGGVAGLRPDKLINQVLMDKGVDGPSARKIVEFAEALFSDPYTLLQHHAVLDSHMAKAMGDRRGPLDFSDEVTYDAGERAIIELANALGDTPENVQARIWFSQRQPQRDMFADPTQGPADHYGQYLGDPEFVARARRKAIDIGMDDAIARRTAEDGGSTTDPRTGESQIGEDLWAVSRFKDRERTFDRPLTEEDIRQFRAENADLLADPANHIGTWLDKETGITYLDVASAYPDKEVAAELGKQAKQKAIFNLKSFEDYVIPSLSIGALLYPETEEEYKAANFLQEAGAIAFVLNRPFSRTHAELPLTLGRWGLGEIGNLVDDDFVKLWKGVYSVFEEKGIKAAPGAMDNLLQDTQAVRNSFQSGVLSNDILAEVMTRLSNTELDRAMTKALGQPKKGEYPIKLEPGFDPHELEYSRQKPGGAAGGAILKNPATGVEYMAKSGGSGVENPQAEHTVFDIIGKLWPEIPTFESAFVSRMQGGDPLGDRWAAGYHQDVTGNPPSALGSTLDPFFFDRNFFIRPMADLAGEVDDLRARQYYGNGGALPVDVRDHEIEMAIRHALSQSVFMNEDMHNSNMVYLSNGDLAVLDAGYTLKNESNWEAVTQNWTGRIMKSIFTGGTPGGRDILFRTLEDMDRTLKSNLSPALKAEVEAKIKKAARLWVESGHREPSRGILLGVVAVERLRNFSKIVETIKKEADRALKLQKGDEYIDMYSGHRTRLRRTTQVVNEREEQFNDLEINLEAAVMQAYPVIAALGASGYFTSKFYDENKDNGELAELADPGFADQIAMAGLAGFAIPKGMGFRQIAAAARAFVKRAIGRAPELDALVDNIVNATDEDIVDQVFSLMRQPNLMQRMGAGEVVGDVPNPQPIMPPADRAHGWQDLGWQTDPATGQPLARPAVDLGPGARIVASNTIEPSVENAYQKYTDALYVLDRLHESGKMPPRLYEQAVSEWRKWHSRQLLSASHFESVKMSQSAEDIAGTLQSAETALKEGRLPRRMFTYIVDAADVKLRELRENAPAMIGGATGVAGSMEGDPEDTRTKYMGVAAAGVAGAVAGSLMIKNRVAAKKLSERTAKMMARAAELASEHTDPLAWRKAMQAEFGEAGNPLARELASGYRSQFGIAGPRSKVVATVDKERHAEIAKIYDAAQDMSADPEVQKAYQNFAREVEQQYDYLVGQGIRIVPTQEDPYRNSAEMMQDVMVNRTLKVFAGSADHPLLTPEQNVKFRAVHDFFGHAQNGHQFGPVGEENAFRDHVSMFGGHARRAMATETRGQNSWMNFGPNSHLPPAERPFGEQKAFFLPDWAQKPYGEKRFLQPGFAAEEALKIIAKAGGAGTLAMMSMDEDTDQTYRQLMMLGAGMMTANAFGGSKTLAAIGSESQKALDAMLSSRFMLGEKKANRAMRYLFNGYGLPETFKAMLGSARRQLAAEESMTLDALRATDMTKLPEAEGSGRVRLQQLVTGQIAARGHLGLFSSTPIYQRYSELTKKIVSLGMSKGPQARKLDIHDYHTAVVVGELMHGIHADPTLWADGPGVRSVKKLAREELKARRKAGALLPLSDEDFELEVERLTRSKTADEIRRLKKDGFIRIPGKLARRTPLRGKYVRRDIVDELERIYNTPQQIRKHGETFQRLHTIWKRFHTVDNPATHVTNVISNMVTGEVSGVLPMHDPRTWKHVGRSFGELVDWLKDGKLSPDIDQALKLGMLQGDLQGMAEFSRITSVLAQYRYRSGGATGLAEAFGKVQHAAGKVAGATQMIYQFEEQLFKLATYKRAISRGATPEEAVKLAEKWFFDYSDVSPLIDDLRTKWWGIPFITWSAKMAPRALELAADHPIKVMAGLGALTAISQGGIFPHTEDEDLPWFIKYTPGAEEGRAFVNSVIPATPEDSKRPRHLRSRFPGDVNALNIGSEENPNLLGMGRYMPIPFVQPREPGQNTGAALAQGVRRSFEGPVARGLSELVGNRHLDQQGFRNEIMDENSSLIGQAMQFGLHQAKDYLPPLAPGGHAWNNLTAQEPWRRKALEEFPEDPDMQPRGIGSRAAHAFMGLSTTGPMSEMRMMENEQKALDAEGDRANAGMGIPSPVLPKKLEQEPILVGYDRAIEAAMKAGDMEKAQRIMQKQQEAMQQIFARYGLF